jgi:DNA-binding MarR family transcriptional regulator
VAVSADSSTETSGAAPTATADPARDAWKAIIELVGWGSGRSPRFPMVAAELDLSPKQLGTLWRLQPGAEGLPMREIAESLYCDASYVTDMVDKLEQRGLIERRADERDRRVKRIALTPEGEKVRARGLELLYEPPAALSALPDDEQRKLAELLGRVLAG